MLSLRHMPTAASRQFSAKRVIRWRTLPESKMNIYRLKELKCPPTVVLLFHPAPMMCLSWQRVHLHPGSSEFRFSSSIFGLSHLWFQHSSTSSIREDGLTRTHTHALVPRQVIFADMFCELQTVRDGDSAPEREWRVSEVMLWGWCRKAWLSRWTSLKVNQYGFRFLIRHRLFAVL